MFIFIFFIYLNIIYNCFTKNYKKTFLTEKYAIFHEIIQKPHNLWKTQCIQLEHMQYAMVGYLFQNYNLSIQRTIYIWNQSIYIFNQVIYISNEIIYIQRKFTGIPG